MTVIPGTYLPGDDNGSGIAREPVADAPNDPEPDEQEPEGQDFRDTILGVLNDIPPDELAAYLKERQRREEQEPEAQEPDVPAPHEPTPEEIEDQRRGGARAATVMASEGTSDCDSPHVPGGLEGIKKAIGED